MIAHVLPPAKPLAGRIEPPSSKNFTTRYALASALAAGRSVVQRPAVQDDAVALVRCLRGLGAEVEALDRQGRPTEFVVENAREVDRLEVHGFGRYPRLRNPAEPLNPGNAGAVFRMLLAVSALLEDVRWETKYKDSLGKRPNRDLIDALVQLGVEVEFTGDDGRLPMRLRGGLPRIHAHVAARRKELGLGAGDPYPVTVAGGVSSQYTSALLFLAPLLDLDLEFHVTGNLKSLPLIETTRHVLSRAGIGVESDTPRTIHRIRAGQHYNPRTWETNGDWPGSAAILGAAAVIPGSEIRVRRLYLDEQGEKECLSFYEKMGCDIRFEPTPGVGEELVFAAPQALQGAAINGDLCTDAVLAMMGAAACAEGESRFVDIRNLQFKECDRVREPLAELRKVYATALLGEEVATLLPEDKALYHEPEDDPDIIHVRGVPQGYDGGITVDGRGDHRVIMMLSIVALRCRLGLRILGAEHVAKSFPLWFDTLRAMGVTVNEEPG